MSDIGPGDKAQWPNGTWYAFKEIVGYYSSGEPMWGVRWVCYPNYRAVRMP